MSTVYGMSMGKIKDGVPVEKIDYVENEGRPILEITSNLKHKEIRKPAFPKTHRR